MPGLVEFYSPISLKAMQKMRNLMLSPQKEQEVIGTLTYKGKLEAIKLYLAYTGCRLKEAKVAVEKLGQDIEPGQAS